MRTRSSQVRGPLIAALLAALTVPTSVAADVVTLNANHDNTLIEAPLGNSNGTGDGIYSGRVNVFGNGTLRRALLSFDLSSIPAGSTIDSVTVTLTMVQATNTLTPTHTLHRVNASWGEEASLGQGQGAVADTGDATWIHRFATTVAWASAGGDFAAAASGSQVVGDIGPYSFTGAGLVADAQFWLDNPTANFGWLLKGDEAAVGSVKKFSSREGFNPPTLRVVYTTSNTGAESAARAAGVTFAPPSPQPSTGPVRLAYSLPRAARVSLSILDASGRVVRQLLSDVEGRAGHHSAVWDGDDASGRRAAPGLYLASLVVDGESKVRRISLLR